MEERSLPVLSGADLSPAGRATCVQVQGGLRGLDGTRSNTGAPLVAASLLQLFYNTPMVRSAIASVCLLLTPISGSC